MKYSSHVLVSPEKEIQKDLYRRVLGLLASANAETRQWLIAQNIFEYALFHLDTQRKGLSIRYARVGTEYADGIHSLYETSMYGTRPWSATACDLTFWGSTHLAASAVTSQRMQIWDVLDDARPLFIDVDENEQSLCASPVMCGQQLAGVLLLSSTQPGFFMDALIQQAVYEYTLLLTLAFDQRDFKPFAHLHLRVMPTLDWQRSEMKRLFIQRVLSYVQQHKCLRKEAETVVLSEMELEFELQGRLHLAARISLDM